MPMSFKDFIGKKFDKNDKDRYNKVEIAKRVRKEIANAKKKGIIDKGFKISVTKDKRAINVMIKDVPEGVVPDSKVWKDVDKTLETIVNYWNYDKSDVSNDHHNKNYYGFVEYDHELMKRFK